MMAIISNLFSQTVENYVAYSTFQNGCQTPVKYYEKRDHNESKKLTRTLDYKKVGYLLDRDILTLYSLHRNDI